MGKQTATLRQRGSSTTAADTPQQQQQQSPSSQYKSEEEVTIRDRVQFYVLQYIGLVFCAAGVGVLAGGYDRGWMGNTALCWVCLVLCLIGLLFHEFRPFNVSSVGDQWRWDCWDCSSGAARLSHIQHLPTQVPACVFSCAGPAAHGGAASQGGLTHWRLQQQAWRQPGGVYASRRPAPLLCK